MSGLKGIIPTDNNIFDSRTLAPMINAFGAYARELEALVVEALASQSISIPKEQIAAALDGGPRLALRSSIPINKRREIGAFFTGSLLAQRALRSLSGNLSGKVVLLDPACGAGDLLVRCAYLLPVGTDLGTTLTKWGEQLAGYDLHQEFVRATKARLVLAAMSRGVPLGHMALSAPDQWFPRICVGNSLEQADAFRSASYIVVNPPYHMTKAPEDCVWGGGNVSMAAVFLDVCISNAQRGTRIIAILPDVLRSGERYEKWRGLISAKADIEKVAIFGQFDPWTDIDVFTLHLNVNPRATTKQLWRKTTRKPHIGTVGDLFDIHVGSVVPYRDPKKGPIYPYIISRDLPRWETVSEFTRHRKYFGKVFTPPFVVVRRTSRPGDQYRAIGTLITGRDEIAVENHLLVLQPKEGRLKSCRALLKVLCRPETTNFLDQRIRCRHLTVSSLRELPWWGTEK